MRLPPNFEGKTNLTPYECMLAFGGLKQHFNPANKYDWFKYKGNMRVAAPEVFEKQRNSVFQFRKIAKHKDPIGLMVANLSLNPKLWIGSLLDESANAVYMAWKARMESLSHCFKRDLDSLPPLLDESLLVPTGSHPLLLRRVMAGHFGLDSFCILNHQLNFYPYWDETIKEPIIWSDWRQKAKALYPFLVIDVPRTYNIMVERFPELKEPA